MQRSSKRTRDCNLFESLACRARDTEVIFSIRQKSFAAQALLMHWECVLQDQGQYDPKNPSFQNTLTAFRMSMTNAFFEITDKCLASHQFEFGKFSS